MSNRPDASGNACSSDEQPTTVSASSEPPSDWVSIGPLQNYTSRTEIRVRKRYITILPIRTIRAIRPSLKLHAIDTTCYHAGGPLTEGRVKRVAGRVCLECPWHHYLVDIESGEGLYMDLNRRYCSKGVRQRVHEIEIRDGEVCVRLRGVEEHADEVDGEGKESVESDRYAYWTRVGAGEVPTFGE